MAGLHGDSRSPGCVPSVDSNFPEIVPHWVRSEAVSDPDVTQPLDAGSPEPVVPASGFAAGDTVAGRYRIVSMLGRGGMGEVYRADDLTLGQSVALKFLPVRVSTDPVRLEALRREVRLTRQVSHPNVCRVYDVDEADGRHFLAMEFVDGEDLGVLLARIGRLPGEKAVQIARQICAGLAAAHEQGVIHRDLKPANVMIDGRGNARLMDFGVATVDADLAEGAAVMAGTPAYMAPEQLDGREVSARSDVYALGLVLYELFTGRAAFESGTIAEMRATHRSSVPPTDPSEHVADIDPAVEATILACLEPDPVDRPASALAVMAALPGGDPLRAMLEAGETPSPELVAASGRRGTLPAWLAWGLVATVAISLVVQFGVASAFSLGQFGSVMPSPAVLAYQAREHLEALAPDLDVQTIASGPGLRSRPEDLVGDLPPDEALAAMDSRFRRPWFGHRSFWYRTHDGPLVPLAATLAGGRLGEVVTRRDPPVDQIGMTVLEIDVDGRLILFERVTPPVPALRGPVADAADPDWAVVLRAVETSGLEVREAEPSLFPTTGWDRRRAWVGMDPATGEAVVRIEAAALGARVTSVRLIDPSVTDAGEDAVAGDRLNFTVSPGMLIAILGWLISGGLAIGNLRAGRGDVRGAFRLGLVFFCLTMIGWVVGTSHSSDVLVEARLLNSGITYGIARTVLACTLYIGLEPHLRRVDPALLVSWSRLLAGRVRDPIVGRDVLIGFAVATFIVGGTSLLHSSTDPVKLVVFQIMDVSSLASLHVRMPVVSTGAALTLSGVYVLFRLLVPGSPRFAMIGFLIFCTLFGWAIGFDGMTPIEGIQIAMASALFVFVVSRIGLLATASMMLVFDTMRLTPLTYDPAQWYFLPAIAFGLFVLSMSVVGAVACSNPRGGGRLTGSA